jgi:hypothetical protein
LGVPLYRVLELFQAGYVAAPNPRVLDVGCSNVHSIDARALMEFVLGRNPAHDPARLAEWADLVAAGSLMDAEIGGINGGWLGDVLVRAGCEYTAFDIFAGYRTELFDLNEDRLEPRHRGRYDLVLNFGTTEHVLGQYNAFRVIHDAAAVGGVIYHDLPMTGHLDHGFLNYNPVLLVSLAEANGYEILKLGFSGALGGERIAGALADRYRDRDWFEPLEDADWARAPLPTGSVRLIARKLEDRPFRTSLETSTTVGEVSVDIDRNYGAAQDGWGGSARERKNVLARIRELLFRAQDPDLTLEDMNAAYDDFVRCGFTKGFPFTLELKMLAETIAEFPNEPGVIARNEAATELFRQERPLLKHIDAEGASGGPDPALRFDGVEAGFAPQGDAQARFQAIVQAYRAYRDRCAVELFPLRLEAEALKHLARTGPRDVDVLIRLGKVASELSPVFDTAARAAAQSVA